MECPRCFSELVVVEAKQVELDWCPDCGGVWFDEGEAELLLGRKRPLSELFTAPDETTDPVLKCPRCSERLTKVSLGKTLLDKCPRGHGIWFDRGEITSLKEASEDEESKRIVEYLIETFCSPEESASEGGTNSQSEAEPDRFSGGIGKKEDS